MTEKGEKIYNITSKILLAILAIAVILFIVVSIIGEEDLLYIPIVMAIVVCVVSLPAGLIIQKIYKKEENTTVKKEKHSDDVVEDKTEDDSIEEEKLN